MLLQDECPICYRTYGEQHDGSFLCKDGKDNSDYSDVCQHYICVECCTVLAEQETVSCPLCREDWANWIHSHYPDEESGEEEDF
jgi:hypothetical protein